MNQQKSIDKETLSRIVLFSFLMSSIILLCIEINNFNTNIYLSIVYVTAITSFTLGFFFPKIYNIGNKNPPKYICIFSKVMNITFVVALLFYFLN